MVSCNEKLAVDSLAIESCAALFACSTAIRESWLFCLPYVCVLYVTAVRKKINLSYFNLYSINSRECFWKRNFHFRSIFQKWYRRNLRQQAFTSNDINYVVIDYMNVEIIATFLFTKAYILVWHKTKSSTRLPNIKEHLRLNCYWSRRHKILYPPFDGILHSL